MTQLVYSFKEMQNKNLDKKRWITIYK